MHFPPVNRRFGIADVVAFLCSPLASAVTGAAWRADGGVVGSIV